MQQNNNSELKTFFIKLISITISIIIIINVIFNLVLGDRLEKIDKIFSVFEYQDRKNIKNNILSELEKSLEKEEIIDKNDKLIILKLYNKIKKEFKELEVK
tara:strand:+ start:496 stop:798 length:303 start_codon:yes stop_codon:yes gene_type:complete